MSSDVLQVAVPRRLHHQDGRWVLEVESLVPLTRCIFRPTLGRIEGEDAILLHLTNSATGQAIVGVTSQLLRAAVHAESRSYELTQAGWIAAGSAGEVLALADVAELRERNERLQQELEEATVAREQLLARVATLDAELTALRSQVNELRNQVAARGGGRGAPFGVELPGMDLGGVAADAAAPEAAPNAAELAALAGIAEPRIDKGLSPDEIAADPHMAQMTQDLLSAFLPMDSAAEPTPSALAEPPTKSTQPQMPVPAVAVAPPAAPAPAVDPALGEPLRLPALTAVNETLGKLFESGVSAEKTSEEFPIRPESGALYFSGFTDDTETLVGCVLADLIATAQLGGRLLAVDASDIEQQIAAGEASADAIDGTSEVINMLKGTLTSAAGKHLNLQGLKRVDFATDGWIANARRREDLVVSVGGHLVILAR